MANTAHGHPHEDVHREGKRNEHEALPDTMHEAAEQTVAEVRRAREPRWRALAKSRLFFAAYVLVLGLVIALAFAVRAYSVLPGDLPFTRELQEQRNPALSGLLFAVSYIGYPSVSGVIVALAVAAMLAARMWLAALFTLLTLLADALSSLIKQIVGRQRPTPSLVHVTQVIQNPSFPSGHVLHYTVFYGFLAFVLATSFRRSWPRNALIGVCLALIVLVGPSRVYLGEHWLSDVVGGYLIGALFLVPLIAAYIWARERFARD